MAAVIRLLVGDAIDVHYIRLQGCRAFGVGRFKPNPVLALAGRTSVNRDVSLDLPGVTVEFRKLPRYARIADEVRRLHVEAGLSLTEIGKRLDCGTGNAWGALAYWHSSRGLEIPYKRAGVKARHRRPAS